MLKSCIIAFAMYSKIPMPVVDWNKKNMRYIMCFLPLIGLVIGALEMGAFCLMEMLSMGTVFRAVILTAIPVFVTGGIHMDGFMDTMDAKSSWGDREKKLEILKDSHTGAFAILGCVMYMVLNVAGWSEMTREGILLMAQCFVLSRCLSGLGVTCIPCAKNSGLVHTFSDAAHKVVVRRILIVELLICCGVMLWSYGIMAAAMLAVSGLTFWYYYWFSMKDFGGITGDLAGFFLQVCELVQLLVLVVILHLI